MVKVLRCPACGALWRLKADQGSLFLRCTECQCVFSNDKAESVDIDERILDERLAQDIPDTLPLEKKSAEADATMSRLAEELSDFESGNVKPEEKEEPPLEEAPVACDCLASTSGHSSSSALWIIVAVFSILVLLVVGLLFAHKPVLNTVPQLRNVYENVCDKLPCPGFVWRNADAFKIEARIAPPETESDDLEQEMQILMPVVLTAITNHSVHPQYLPILELKLLDAAGETIAQRMLEQTEYGYTPDAVLAPGDRLSVRLSILTPLPYQAHDAVVTPVGDLR